MNRILVIYIYTLFSHRHAVNITSYSVNVPHVVYPCKPESRIKSESETYDDVFLCCRCYLWLFTLYINIKISKNSCYMLD